MRAKDIAERIPGWKKSGNYYTAKCPAHDDKTNSLTIRDGDKSILLKCHAGCSNADIIDRLKADGIWEAKAPVQKNQSRQDSKLTHTYSYTNEIGELAHQTLRLEPKSFRQRRPDHNNPGKWIYSLKDTQTFLYNLPAVMRSEKGIVLVEGEKDADRLISLGVCATTAPMGAGKWRPEYTEYLKGKKVYLIPDKDEAGFHHMVKIASMLDGVADEYKLVELPGLSDKEDISDWLDKGHTKEELSEIIINSPSTRLATHAPAPLATHAQTPTKPPVTTTDWVSQLIWRDIKGGGRVLAANVNNAELFLSNHSDITGIVRYNETSKRIEITRQPPWDPDRRGYPRQIMDIDGTRATAWLERLGVKVGIPTVHAALESVAHHQSYNPLTDYLSSLKWDGKPRIETMLIDYFGAEPTDYARAISKRFMISAAARAIKPGCKVDTMLILEGDQGTFKSTAIAELFSDEWFTDELSEIGSKDAAMQLQGVWCVEVAEMATMIRSEVKRLKEFLARRIDKFRPTYGRHVVESKRHCVFVGTVNPTDGYLKDETGARRFWPIKTNEIKLKQIIQDRDQLWAESVQYYRDGERWWLDDKESIDAREEQLERYEDDAWTDQIVTFLGNRNSTSMSEILNDGLELLAAQQTHSAKIRAGKILTILGFDRKRVRVGNNLKWLYFKRVND